MEHSRTSIINYIIEQKKYRSYLEIGIRNPWQNFDLIKCNFKHGIDPAVNHPQVSRMTSDAYFSSHDDKYDLVFIDGDHTMNGVIKDVANALIYISERGTIVMHDCFPKTEGTQGDEITEDVWHGSAWKVFASMRMTMSNLSMYTCEADCGCGIIRYGEQELFRPLINMNSMTWDFLVENRQELMRMTTFDECIKLETVQ